MKRKPNAVDLHASRPRGPNQSLHPAATGNNGSAADRLPPHSPEAEQAVLGCCILAPKLILEHCKFLRADAFYDLRHATIWATMKDMADRRKVVDTITLRQRLRDKKQLDEIGGDAYVATLVDSVQSTENLQYYLDILMEKCALRATIHVCTETVSRVYDYEGDVESLMLGIRADMETVTSLKAGDKKPALKIWRVDELAKWKAPNHLKLIGDNEIFMGYEGLALIAGPGSVGKSMAVSSLALAGAIGSGTWMGRKVHRQFKTMFLQAENGRRRMKAELAEMTKGHPEADLQEHVFMSEPPEGGLPFHRSEFRAAVRQEAESIKPNVVVIDPWSQLAVDDASKDIMEKLGEVRSCFPSGDDCPALIILAHTKKPRPEDVRRGRALTNLVSGSVALPNTCRCVYLCLPWVEEQEDDRIYWACTKLNDGVMYTSSVWHRRFGTFFVHDPETDPKTWGNEDRNEEERRVVDFNDVVNAFSTEHVLTPNVFVRRMQEITGASDKTIYRIIKPPKGYLAQYLETTKEGYLQLKSNGAPAKPGAKE